MSEAVPQVGRTPLPPCCARKMSQITFEKGHLRSLAKRAARRPQDPALQALIAQAKQLVASAEKSFELHIHDDTLEHK